MPRRTSVVEGDGKPGRMPPRMGAWQPERLRYGAATKNQRVAGRFPERRMSPRAIPPATPPPLPKRGLHRASAARSHSRRGHAAPELGSPISGGVLEARRESTRSDSAGYDARPGRSPAGASHREQPGWFPCVESTPQHTPYTWNWRIRFGDPAVGPRSSRAGRIRRVERELLVYRLMACAVCNRYAVKMPTFGMEIIQCKAKQV